MKGHVSRTLLYRRSSRPSEQYNKYDLRNYDTNTHAIQVICHERSQAIRLCFWHGCLNRHVIMAMYIIINIRLREAQRLKGKFGLFFTFRVFAENTSLSRKKSTPKDSESLWGREKAEKQLRKRAAVRALFR